MFAALLLLVLQTPAVQTGGVHGAAYSADGRLAIAVRGDLWIRAGTDSTSLTRLTSGVAWDREPAWSADGSSIVFASDRAGGSDLWRVRVGPAGAIGEPERLTTSVEWEGEPTVARDGSVLFVRGRGPMARLWLRTPTGGERRLSKDSVGAERSPAIAPDGRRVAYIAANEGRSRLRVRWLDGDSSRVIVEDRDAIRPAWSPSGDRLAFATRGPRGGVWITTPDGRYVNLVSERAAAPAWSPDGRSLALVGLGAASDEYNGDPDRVGDRDVIDIPRDGGMLWTIDVPRAPDAGLTSLPVALAGSDRASYNAEAFDRVWSRTAQLYYAGAESSARAEWTSLSARYRPRALAAPSDSALAAVVHEMLRLRPPLRRAAAGRAAVSSAHPVATEAGLEVLRKGGNVVDAAVAVSFALGVVEPDASGIGGYGQMLVHLRGMERPALIEFMSRAPEEAALDNATLLERGRAPVDGPILANVPGTVAAMHRAWSKYGSGKLKWADLLAPAIRAADQGYVVSDGLATTLATEREHFLKYQGSRALFFRNGEPLHAGDTLRNPDLAWTLRQIADSGPSAFYKGEVARRMVTDLRGHGNAMRPSDLASYFAVEREPVAGTYRGYTLFSSAPPSAGGATLVAQLNMLEPLSLRGPYTDDAATLHAMIEAWKLVPSSRGRVADPGLWPVTVEAFVSKDSARARWRCFDAGRALTPADVRGDSLPCAGAGAQRISEAAEEGAACPAHDELAGARLCHRSGTTSFAIADADGNVVSTTQTLGTWGGNFYVTPGLGFLYNDKLTSYGSDPTEYGARLPYARHGSSLAPTIVFAGAGPRKRPVLATGAAGNAWITAAVYSIVTGVLDQKLDPQRAVEQPRFLLTERPTATGREYVVQMEAGISPDVLRRLEAMGHRFQQISLDGELRMGYAAVVAIGQREARAAADPRRSGTAGAVGCGEREADGCRER
jgi:gamma-glutamyltranspeptidase / glutathione hydrolase